MKSMIDGLIIAMFIITNYTPVFCLDCAVTGKHIWKNYDVYF